MDTISPTPDAGTAATILDVTTESFMADVIEASATQLVLLDLWAPWCGPCKQLTPLLEQVTAQANGAVRLAKMNIDEHPAVAQQLQVQSIPAVFAFKNGRPVDGFMGALPESQIKEFVTRHLGDELAASPVAPWPPHAKASAERRRPGAAAAAAAATAAAAAVLLLW